VDPSTVTAIVTGGTSGLGAATAVALVRRGARVAIVGRSVERGTALASALGPAACFLPADVTDTKQLDGAVQETVARFGAIQALVHCAGVDHVMKVLGRDEPAPLESFLEVLRVNLGGAFNAIRLAGAVMSRNPVSPDGERGVIVLTSSVAAFDGQIGQAAYAASKSGLVGMTWPIAQEFARLGIRIATLAPGLFDTPMLGRVPTSSREALRARLPFPHRFGRPEEFAALTLHVIENPSITGQTIRLDGALHMVAS
jgi:3-hydroxyacyl-CoA dehydrogenase / 3-hydroxy-2-methylbutyryl-CoA dehydrogenase